MIDSPYINAQASSKAVQNCAVTIAEQIIRRGKVRIIKPAVIKGGKVIKKAITKPAT